MIFKPEGRAFSYAPSRRDIIRIAGATTLGLTTYRDLHRYAWAAASEIAIQLRNLAASKKLIFGAAIASKEIEKDPEFADLVAKQCDIIVPSVELQWKLTQSHPDQENDFSAPDRLYAFASQHDMMMRGHALLYHLMAPTWLNESVGNPRAVIENHIRTKASHFKGRLQSWDVVNEVTDPKSSHKYGLAETQFLKLHGDDYIERAFEIAAEVDPHAKRVFSDAALEGKGSFLEKKRALVLENLNRLIRKKIPVQYIGIHGHLHGNLDAAAFDRFLSDCISLGLKIMVTELDVFDTEMSADLQTRDAETASVVKEFLDIVLAYKETSALLCWGLSDRYSWVKSFAPRPDGLPVRPLPYDAELKPKSMVKAIADAIKRAPIRA